MGKKIKKATNLVVNQPYLKKRADILANAGYVKPKWIGFCETMLAKGYVLTLYEARETFSKYITVSKSGFKPYKVRFSNHKAIYAREMNGDCDFFVGVGNLKVTTTEHAILATDAHFTKQKYELNEKLEQLEHEWS